VKKITEHSGHELQKLLAESSEPVIAEFFTRSCVKCRHINVLLQEIVCDYSKNFRVVRLDIEKHPGMAARYEIAAVPTLLFFVNGHTRLRIVGSVAKKDLLRVIHEDLLAFGES
jgi:thioredoxin 1